MESPGRRAAALVERVRDGSVSPEDLAAYDRRELRIAVGMMTGTEPPLSTKRPELERHILGGRMTGGLAAAESYKAPRTGASLDTIRRYAYLHGGDVIDIMEEQAVDWSESEIDRVLLPHGNLAADIGTFLRQTRQAWRGAPGDLLDATPDPTYTTVPTTAMTARLSRRSFGLSNAVRRRMADALEREAARR